MAAGLIYNFNENSATTIRDYSEGGNDGTGTNLTIASSTRVGNDAVFNSTTDQIDMGNITLLNGETSTSLHFGISVTSGGSGATIILKKLGQIQIGYNYTTNTLQCTLVVASGNATVSYAISEDTFYDIDIVWASDVLTLYVDGVSQDTDSTESGEVATNGNTMYLGDTGSSDGTSMLLNEFMIFNSGLSTDNINSLIAEQNGIYSDSGLDASFNVGDIIGADTFDTAKYAIVSWVGANSEFRFYPISSNISSAKVFIRVGHLWDTARQYVTRWNDDEICWYNGVSLSTEAFTAAKEVFCIDKDGFKKSSITKTANYTATSYDQRINIDSSGGAFTITLEASPVTNREIEIIDYLGNCNTNNVTVAGNGNNINGSANGTISSDYEAWRLIFNGTEWNLN